MSATEVIDQIKHLPPNERIQVLHYVVEHKTQLLAGKATVSLAADGSPLIHAPGVITSSLVRELEGLTP